MATTQKAPKPGEVDRRPPSRRPKPQNRKVPTKDGQPIGPFDNRIHTHPKVMGRFDAAARTQFLLAYAEQPLLYLAAQAANVCAQTIRYWMKRDPTLVDDMEEARLRYGELLHAEVHRRGVDGVEVPVFWQGKDTGHRVRKYSDRMLELQIKRHDPAYRERFDVTSFNRNTNVNTDVPANRIDMAKLSDKQLKGMRMLVGADDDV